MINLKPPFTPVTAEEVNTKANTNGYKVVSTFSGCGGASFGLKLAGFNMVYANEFIPAAQDTYSANHPKTYLDKRDIRKVKAEEILKVTGLKKGELDLFEGSPPCAAFSNCGKRDKGWNTVKKYSDTKQRVDDLFFEYNRLLKDLQPKMFISENVKGLTQKIAKGYLKLIVHSLRDSGYNVKLKVLNSNYYNVPQIRERLIIMGVRKDLDMQPVFPKPLKYRYTVGEAIPYYLDKSNEFPKDAKHLDKKLKTTKYVNYAQRHGLTSLAEVYKKFDGKGSGFTHMLVYPNKPCNTILQTMTLYHPKFNRSLSIPEVVKLQTLPDDMVLTGSIKQRWERVGRSVPPRLYEAVGTEIKKLLDKM